MCTLTVTPLNGDRLSPGGRLIAMNRDERKSRLPCSGIRRLHNSNLEVLYPEDGESRGTWLALNSLGYVFALTNFYPAGKTLSGRITRGVIAKNLAVSMSTSSLSDGLASLRMEDFGPFRLVIVPPTGAIRILTWDTTDLREEMDTNDYFFLTSAAFINESTAQKRKSNWSTLVQKLRTFDDQKRIAAIRNYHLHHDPQHPNESVCMDRPEARTFSYTEVISSPTSLQFRHTDQPLVLSHYSEDVSAHLDRSLRTLKGQ